MNDLLRDFPPSFETERLTIRCPQPGDGILVNAAVLESLDQLRPWMGWAKQAPTLEASEEDVRKAQISFLQRFSLRMLLFLKETNTLVGSSGLHNIDWAVPKFEIGYWVRTAYAGQGYVTEAVKGITDFAFATLGARRVEIRCDTRNERSIRVAERAGFPLEATLHCDDLCPLTGELRDTHIFAKIKRKDNPL